MRSDNTKSVSIGLDGKVIPIERQSLPDDIKSTFADSQYDTVVAKEDLVLYRVYGGKAVDEGCFCTTERPTDRMAVKDGLALNQRWGNDRSRVVEIHVPKGTVLQVGKAAPQEQTSAHNDLSGGLDQVLLPKDFFEKNPDSVGAEQQLDYNSGYGDFIRGVEEKREQPVKMQEQTDKPSEVKEGTGTHSMGSDLRNPDLFKENSPGEYHYGRDEHGKTAYGNLQLEKGVRNAYAQRKVGGEDRRRDDDGGHMIGTRFKGASGTENLNAQNRDVNRGTYKNMENQWAESLENGSKVFVNTEAYQSEGSERPEAFMGYAITETPDGKRDWEAFSIQNESSEVQSQWDEEVAKTDIDDSYENPIDYDPAEYEVELLNYDTPASKKEKPEDAQQESEALSETDDDARFEKMDNNEEQLSTEGKKEDALKETDDDGRFGAEKEQFKEHPQSENQDKNSYEKGEQEEEKPEETLENNPVKDREQDPRQLENLQENPGNKNTERLDDNTDKNTEGPQTSEDVQDSETGSKKEKEENDYRREPEGETVSSVEDPKIDTTEDTSDPEEKPRRVQYDVDDTSNIR